MNSDNSGYDIYTSTFSPEGHIYQVEYANRACLNSGTAIGMRGSDGVVFAVENIADSSMLESGANRRIFEIDRHIGAVVAGYLPDARHIMCVAEAEAAEYKMLYGLSAPLSYIRRNVSAYVHAHTQYSGLRPFGASVILGSYTQDGPQLYCIEPSGANFGYFGCAIGKAADEAKLEMRNIADLRNTSIKELVKQAAKIIYAVHDFETYFKLDLMWSGDITNGRIALVPLHVQEEAKHYAEAMLENEYTYDSE